MCVWGDFDENTACGLCYTSGTTGDPQGRALFAPLERLHALAANQTDALGCGAERRVLPVVPMFHANAWGIAFSAPAVGAKLVMPGAKLDGAVDLRTARHREGHLLGRRADRLADAAAASARERLKLPT
jgi:fatty-acyl-CoA synthase